MRLSEKEIDTIVEVVVSHLEANGYVFEQGREAFLVRARQTARRVAAEQEAERQASRRLSVIIERFQRRVGRLRSRAQRAVPHAGS